MKVTLNFQDCADDALHTSLKITLPKKWPAGPSEKLLSFFVASYNKKFPDNELDATAVHLEGDDNVAIASDAIIETCIADRAKLFVVKGAPPTLASLAAAAEAKADEERKRKAADSLKLSCTRFGCTVKKYLEEENADDACRYHLKPPVFHETRKFWGCCPDKVAYDWDTFLAIPGCQTGRHTNVKQGGPSVMGGSDLRAEAAGVPTPPKCVPSEDGSGGDGGDGGERAQEPRSVSQLRAALGAVGVRAETFDGALRAARGKVDDGNDSAAAKELGICISAALRGFVASCE